MNSKIRESSHIKDHFGLKLISYIDNSGKTLNRFPVDCLHDNEGEDRENTQTVSFTSV
jgi:hypothetical protein